MYKEKITEEDLLNFEASHRALIATDGKKKSIHAILTFGTDFRKYIVHNGVESSYLTVEAAVNAYNRER